MCDLQIIHNLCSYYPFGKTVLSLKLKDKHMLEYEKKTIRSDFYHQSDLLQTV